MPNKYIIHGAANNGDGTASNEAASAGAPGAWSNINILSGSAVGAGALDSGDTVYIRSKSSAGADLAIESTGVITIGASGKTVNWVLDNGVVWPGIDGTLTVRHTGSGGSDGYVKTLVSNVYIAKRKLAWVVTATGWAGHNFFQVVGGSTIEGFHVTLPVTGTPIYSVGVGVAKAVNCKITAYAPFSTYGVVYVAYSSNAFKEEFHLINPTIEVTTSIQASSYLFKSQLYGGPLMVIGGRVTGAYLEAGGYKMWEGIGHIKLNGFKFPNNTTPVIATLAQLGDNYFSANGCDDLFGTEYADCYGAMSSRKDNNFPTLNALLPNAASTPWAWWVYLPNVSRQYAASLPMRKVYGGSAAQLTVTLNLLVSTVFTEISKENCYITVCYTEEATGLSQVISSRDISGGALASSTAGWTFTSYGAVSFDKKEISVQTPSQVKPGSLIEVLLYVETPSNSTSKLLIVCPDVQAF